MPTKIGTHVLAATLALAMLGCSQNATTSSQVAAPASVVTVDGSSTVFPIAEAMAEEYQKAVPGVRVTVGLSGTGGGFRKFAAGEIDIAGASRPITSSEKEASAKNGIAYIEAPIAYDGICVVVNLRNEFVQQLTSDELKRIWEPESKVQTWSDVRDGWPERPIRLYGPGTDSGTFDYFTEEIVGKPRTSRADYTASEDDNTLVQGVAGDTDALGYFGYSYYIENRDKVKAVAVDGVLPTEQTIGNGSYQPLSRPLYVYVSESSLDRPQVRGFVEFALQNAPRLTQEVGYVPMPDTEYETVLQRLQQKKTSAGGMDAGAR